MRHRNPTIAIRALVATLVLTLLGLAGTTTRASADATVSVTGGTLRITGTPADESLIITELPDPGSYAVTVNPAGGPSQSHSVSGVTNDVIIDLGGGDDITYLGDAAVDTSFPRSVTITATEGNDWTYIHRASVTRDLNLNGRSYQVNNSSVGRNLTGLTTAHNGAFGIQDAVVGGLVQLRSTQGGRIAASIARLEAARFRVTGGADDDAVSVFSSDLGASPRFDGGGGADGFRVSGDTTWTGTATVNGGAGADIFRVLDFDANEDPLATGDLGRLNVRLGTGEDIADVRMPLTTPGSVVDGQAGTDTLEGDGVTDPASNATFRNFETDPSQPPAAPVTAQATQGDLSVDVTGPVHDVFIDRVGGGVRVTYRLEAGGISTNIDVPAVNGDLAITVTAGSPKIFIGHDTDTNVNGRLTFDAVGSGVQPKLFLVEIIVSGDFVATGRGGALLAIDSDSSHLDGRVIVRGNDAAELQFHSDNDRMARLQLIGSSGDDTVSLTGSRAGANPSITVGAGDDVVRTLDADWTGTMRVTAGTGDDTVQLEKPYGGVLGRVRLLMGGGDDAAIIGPLTGDGIGSRLQGDGGEDGLRIDPSVDRATIRTFEQIYFP